MAERATHGPADAGPPGQGDGVLGIELSRPRADAAVLEVRGELDTLTAPELEAGLRELLDDDAPLLVVDLSGVSFLASSGLAVLIHAAHRAEDGSRALHLVVTSRAVLRPLEVTGSDQLFVIHPDRDSALAG